MSKSKTSKVDRQAKIPVPNYTQVPNYLFEIMHELKEAELRVVFAVARKTFGWHRKQARLSVSLLAAMTGLSLQGVRNGIEGAMKRGLVTRTSQGQSFSYQILVKQVDPSTKLTSKRSRGEGVNQVDQASKRSRREPLNEVDTQNKVKKHTKKLLNKQQQPAPGAAEILERLDQLGIEGKPRLELAEKKPSVDYLDRLIEHHKQNLQLGPGFYVNAIRDNRTLQVKRSRKWYDGNEDVVVR